MRFATYSVITTFLLTTFAAAMWSADSIVAQDDPFGSSKGSSKKTNAVAPNPFGGNSNANPFGIATSNPVSKKRAAKKLATKKPVKKARTVAELESKILEALKQESSFDYDETSFVEVMDELAKENKFNVLLDPSAEEDSLTEDTPITFRVKGLPLSSTLKLLLEPHNATYVVKDGVLKIISLDVAYDPENFSQAIIDCRTLIGLIAQQHRAKLSQLAPGRKLTEVTSTPTHIAERNLVSLVKTTIDPEGWDETNGDGTLEFLAGCMVISQNQVVLRDIRELLDELTKKLSPK